MFDFIILGGPILWVIMALSVVACAIIIERFLYLRRISGDENKLFVRIKASLLEGHYNEALSICDQNLSPFSTLLKIGIENRHQSEDVQRDILKDAAALEAPALEKGLSALGTISTISPLLGLLGTVTGTMSAFGVLGKFGAVSDPAALASGVSEALITTVGGLVVAVPVVIFYNYFVSRVNGILTVLESRVNTLVVLINARNGITEKSGSEGL
ncbi:Protein TolQ [bioreactor metagenome]|jgi:biopolymer transport protein ExbB|uniref:Protein TolQ n=2 Tax=root TaxID=1 RepID=A0A644TCA1_9ZZZZ|nr:MotA/TolQ/ExbB proton channel family protein [Spirochaetia bacterium]NLX45955.1 MotA/TolQ/ExbB proton channel family protein [Treponema sp.]VBB38492.1 putative tolQ-type transport protein [uncultured Spirochaetota bacterium]HOI21836.1 MotA/TolQ/ExbB proton channel family protein [Spirochaetales bacterium]